MNKEYLTKKLEEVWSDNNKGKLPFEVKAAVVILQF